MLDGLCDNLCLSTLFALKKIYGNDASNKKMALNYSQVSRYNYWKNFLETKSKAQYKMLLQNW